MAYAISKPTSPRRRPLLPRPTPVPPADPDQQTPEEGCRCEAPVNAASESAATSGPPGDAPASVVVGRADPFSLRLSADGASCLICRRRVAGPRSPATPRD